MKSSSGYTKHCSKCRARFYLDLRMVACNRPIPSRRNFLPPSSYFLVELDTASAKQGIDNDITMGKESVVRIEEESTGAPIGHVGFSTLSTSYLERFDDSQPGRSVGKLVLEQRQRHYRINSRNSVNASRDAPQRRLEGALGNLCQRSFIYSTTKCKQVVCSYIIVVISK